jgi:hypothetical protein
VAVLRVHEQTEKEGCQKYQDVPSPAQQLHRHLNLLQKIAAPTSQPTAIAAQPNASCIMPINVLIKGIGVVSFPESMSEAEITAAIQLLPPPKEKPKMNLHPSAPKPFTDPLFPSGLKAGGFEGSATAVPEHIPISATDRERVVPREYWGIQPDPALALANAQALVDEFGKYPNVPRRSPVTNRDIEKYWESMKAMGVREPLSLSPWLINNQTKQRPQR